MFERTNTGSEPVWPLVDFKGESLEEIEIQFQNSGS